MARISVRMPSPQGVGAGQTATFKLPIGRRYHALYLTYSGTTFALLHMNEIRVIVNGKVIHRYSGVECDTMNKFDGRAAANGTLTIPFDRYKLKTVPAEIETALNTGSIDPKTGVSITSVTVEIDIDALAVAPVLSMTALQSDTLVGGAGTILHRGKFNYSPTGAGEFAISDLPRGNSTSMAQNRIVFIPDVNSISKVTIERNGYTVFERSKALNEMIQTDGVRKPQSGYIVVDRTEGGYGGDPLSLLQVHDLRYKLEMTGASNITILTENLGRLGD
ncbi:MAG: hypothetical protein A2513_04400 [Sulfurimonas sp. RIFOXYD12_FULL_33_39]|uniref:major capsid protein P2 n=1 Tax=unclassified Sulfurimonas TaxID=2623549 RepID=UPI0008D88C2F|nr:MULTISPECIES: major capsid protein P2 [unclassified Sulfurimonas]OHE09375.1 MAG: hypothetical protein A2513_04400 [Sulfurimonas sp. RIFOXYD12_FULL_33_39]OHE12843.1 MAG: hypothetical protein A2530_04405 [Sulfurimonas sp. RIFOXYD2_FULL_34_21]DAB27338.1 MAG TPA: hypothetical protein CFH78_08410 [Sulfurimonas sp. UBA10385]